MWKDRRSYGEDDMKAVVFTSTIAAVLMSLIGVVFYVAIALLGGW